MSRHPHRTDLEEDERERLLRHGLEEDAGADDVDEPERADRPCAGAPPRHYVAAPEPRRSRRGLGRSPYERPNAPEPPPSRRPGDPVSYRGEAGDEPTRHGTVEAVLDDDSGAVVVRLDGGACQVVSADALE
jgi:hypothetical protein